MLHLFLEFPSVLSNFCASKYLIITCPRNILAAEQTVSAAVVLMVTCINTANFSTSICIKPTWYNTETTELMKITVGINCKHKIASNISLDIVNFLAPNDTEVNCYESKSITNSCTY